jgi:hypothetical protein
MIGIKTFYPVVANVPFTSNATLTTVGLTSPIAAGQRQKIRCWIAVTVGAAGGVQVEIVCPAGIAAYTATFKLFNTVAPSLTTASQTTTPAAFGNALANAGTHWLEVEAEITNGVNAGTIDVQIAQNSSNADTMTVLLGSSMDVTKY